jgi:hypothetical protein
VLQLKKSVARENLERFFSGRAGTNFTSAQKAQCVAAVEALYDKKHENEFINAQRLKNRNL